MGRGQKDSHLCGNGKWYVYIMTNKPNGVLYIGATDNIDCRVEEHKTKVYPESFTARYNCDKFISKHSTMVLKLRFEKGK